MFKRKITVNDAAPLVKTRNSIATQLLRTVFSVYLLITVVLTLTHMRIDFLETKQNIYQELKNISKAFYPVLSRSIWDLNPEATQSVLIGINKSSHVTGSVVRDSEGSIVGALGSVFSKNIEASFAHDEELIYQVDDADIFEYSMLLRPISYDSAISENKIGVLTVYSSNKIVFDNVKLGFFLILFNAVLKTAALWILFLWISRHMLARPLATLSQAMDKVKADKLSNLKIDLSVKGHNELTVLEEGFNRMIGNLHEAKNRLHNSNERLAMLLKSIQNLSQVKRKFNAMALVAESLRKVVFNEENISNIQFGYYQSLQKSKKNILIYNYRMPDNHQINYDLLDCNNYSMDKSSFESVKQFVTDGENYIENDGKLILFARRNSNLLGFIEIAGSHSLSLSVESENYINMLVESLSITLDNIYITQGLEMQVSARTQVLKDTLKQLQKEHEKLKETQSKLVHSEKMAGLGVLVAGVAHEINNPVNFVHAGTQNLEYELDSFKKFIFELAGDDASESVKDTFRERFEILFKYSNNILNGSKRIRSIVSELKSFSRFDENNRQCINVIVELESTLKLVKTKYKQEIDFYCDFKSSSSITCWPAKLNQVFLNLLINACQAIQAKQRESLHLSVGHIFIRSFQTAKYLYLSFEDTGLGMPEDVKKKMFDPFFTTKKVGEGTGLGLSLSHEIIERHGGEIFVNTRYKSGTTITLSFPLFVPYEGENESL